MQHGDKLISLILKVAREQGICSPEHKVMIFKPKNEGKPNENVNFKILEVGQEWALVTRINCNYPHLRDDDKHYQISFS